MRAALKYTRVNSRDIRCSWANEEQRGVEINFRLSQTFVQVEQLKHSTFNKY